VNCRNLCRATECFIEAVTRCILTSFLRGNSRLVCVIIVSSSHNVVGVNVAVVYATYVSLSAVIPGSLR